MGVKTASRLSAIVVALGVGALVFVTQGDSRPSHRGTRLRAEAAIAAVIPTTVLAPPVATSTSTTPPPPPPVPAQPAEDRVVFDRSPSQVGAEALKLITYPWQQRLNASVVFAGPRAGYRAISTAYGGRDEIVIYVRPTDTPRVVAVSIAHEIGHLVDYHRLTDADRRQWLAERGRPGVTWWACDYCTDYATGSGDFAETFAAWQAGALDYRSQVAPLPDAAQMQSLARFFK